MARKREETTVPSEHERLRSMKWACGVTSWSRTSIYRLVKAGRFPAPLKLGPQRIAFREAEVLAYVESLRRAGEGAEDVVTEAQASHYQPDQAPTPA